MSIFPTQYANNSDGTRTLALEWNDLAVILAICRAGSLSGAARILGHNHSTVFRKIAAIEDRAGVRFFERMPDGYVMTDAGATAMRYAERIESEVHAMGREVLGQDSRLQGNIRVTSPEGIATQITPGIFAEFRRQHPGVTIAMLGAAAAVDLNRREADIAIRATPKPPDTSLGRKLCDFRFALYSSPAYLENCRDVPLAEHDWVMLEGVVDWLVPLVWKKKAHGDRATVFCSAAVFTVMNMAAEGMGYAPLPCYLGDANERLVRISPPIESLSIELWILTHPDLRHTARVKALMAHLYDKLGKEADLFAGERPRDESYIRYQV